MSDTSYIPIGPVDVQRINCRLCSRQVCVKVAVILTYSAVLLWRFIGLVLYSIHATDCFFREKLASYRCKNFTMFSYANELEISWQMASVINTLLVKVPGY